MATVLVQKCIGKRGTTYAVRYTDPLSGRKKHYKSYKKYKLAHRAANDLRALLDGGDVVENKSQKISAMTFEGVAEVLKEQWTIQLSQNELSKKTYQDYCMWLKRLNQAFGKSLLCQISKEDILSYRMKEAEKNSNVSANKYLAIIKKVFKCGVELNAIKSDPSKEIKKLSEKDHVRDRFIFPHELASLIKASYQTRAKFYLPAIIYLGAEHGASRQEILSLKWPNINFEFSAKGLITFFRTKTGRKRTEYLMPRTKQAILEWKEHQEWMRKRKKFENLKFDIDLVFSHLDGKPITRFDKAWKEACGIAGLKDLHFHDLRHTFCSNLILSGADLKSTKEMIGHADIGMTDRYSHLTMNYKLILQKRLAEHYLNNPDSTSTPL